MPRLVYRSTALREIADIAAYIEQESVSRDTADAFVQRLTDHCERIAILPGLIGHPREDLRPGYRSKTFGNYIIFFRYGDEEGPRSRVYVTNIVYGSRDLDAYFMEHDNEEEP
jgi:toxin ParE1/3/4